MAFAHKDWKDDPDSSTPLSAAALEDMEDRLSGYTDTTVTAHTSDASAAHAASAISVTPSGTIASTDVAAALTEVATDAASALTSGLAGKANTSHTHTAGDLTPGTPASGSYFDGAAGWTPLPAQSGSADQISVTPFGTIAATDVQAALEEVYSEAGGGGTLPTDNTDGQILGSVGTTATWLDVDAAVSAADIPFTPAGTIAASDLQAAVEEVATDAAAALTAHTGDSSAAHAASAISYAGGTGMSATDVEAAIDELADEKADKLVTVNAQTGTSYTLVLGDAGKLVTVSNAATHTLTVPPNSSVAFAVGTVINVARIGAGAVNLAAGVGVTVNSPGSALGLRAQYSQATLIKTATDTWLLGGDIA